MTNSTSKHSKDLKPAIVGTFAQESGAMRSLLTQGEDGHFLIGLHYNNIVDHDLAKQGGYANAHAFIAAEFKDLSQATLSTYSLVAKSFTEDLAKKYGCTKLEELVMYLHNKGLATPTGDPGSTQVDVPQKDGTTQTKNFSDCTSADLKAAKAAGQPATALPAAAQSRLAAFGAALLQLLGAKGKVTVTAAVVNGEVEWTIHKIPDGLFAAILAKLASL
jgi:hypothetical protein